MRQLYFFDIESSHQPILFEIGSVFKVVFKFLILSFLYKIDFILNSPTGVIKSPSFLLIAIPLLPMAHFIL